jgi:hypothetical protein
MSTPMDLPTLLTLDRPGLMAWWQILFHCPAPKSAPKSFLQEVIGWHIQAKQLGSLSAIEKRQLKLGTPSPTGQQSVGSRLIRVWPDQTHQVTILEDGYLYQEQRWKSLSAIAKAITGTPWSGPVFFGLKK